MPATSTRAQQSRTAVTRAHGKHGFMPPAVKPVCTDLIPNPQPIQNRIQILLVHIPRLSIQGQARLAAEVGVSRSTISRLVHGRINPSYRLARGVTTALERLLGCPLDMRDVFSTDGTYLTPSGCVLCGCGGCLPDRAYDPDGNMRPEWRDQRPGDWSMTRPSEVGLLAETGTISANANKSDAIIPSIPAVPSSAAIPNAQEVL